MGFVVILEVGRTGGDGMNGSTMENNIYIALASHCIGLDNKKPYKRRTDVLAYQRRTGLAWREAGNSDLG